MSALPLLIGGAGLNAIGGLLGGASANRAAREARDFADRDYLGSSASLGTSLYGSQAAYTPTIRRLLGSAQQHNDPAAAAQYAQQLDTALRPTQNSLLGRLESTGQDIIRLQNNDLAGFDAESGRIEGMLRGAQDEQRRAGDRSNRQAAGAESIAQATGVGRDRIIRRDAAKRGKAMDQTARASLASSGFGNTTAVANALAGNARSVAEQQDRALQESQDARLASLLTARQRRIDTGQQVAGANYQAGANTAQGAAARNQQRTGLRTAQLANEQTLRYLPMQTQLAAEQGPITNFQNPLAAQAYPGVSGGANALSSVGNTLSAAGGLMLGQQQGGGTQDMLEQMSRLYSQYGVGGYGGWG